MKVKREAIVLVSVDEPRQVVSTFDYAQADT